VKLQNLTNLDGANRKVLAREVKTIGHLRGKLKSYQEGKGHAFPFLIPMVAEFFLAEPLKHKKSLLGNSPVQDIRYCKEFDTVFVMEYAEGGSLHEEIERHKKLTKKHPREQRLGELRLYMAEIVAAVLFLHDAGVVHRDLSLKNILLRGGHIKVADFGLSKRVDSNTVCKTDVGGVIKAPELMREQPYNAKCDVWSYGGIFEVALDLKHARPQDGFETLAADLHEQCTKVDPEERPSFAQLKGHGFFGAVPIPTAHGGKFKDGFLFEIIKGGKVDWDRLEGEAAKAEAPKQPGLPSRPSTSTIETRNSGLSAQAVQTPTRTTSTRSAASTPMAHSTPMALFGHQEEDGAEQEVDARIPAAVAEGGGEAAEPEADAQPAEQPARCELQ